MVRLTDRQTTRLPVGELKSMMRAVADERNLMSAVNVYLVSNDDIRAANKEFFGKDRPTNVISFPMNEKALLGEILVSVDWCAAESDESGLTTEQLVVFYFIHGLLHLVGYEHVHGGRDADEMHEEECRLFRIVFPGIDLEQ